MGKLLTQKIKDNCAALGTIIFIGGLFFSRVYFSSPKYLYNLKYNDEIVCINSEPVGFPVIKQTYAIDRKSDGTIDEAYDLYLAWYGKFGGYSYEELREPTHEDISNFNKILSEGKYINRNK